MAIYSDSGVITQQSTPLIRPTLDLNFAREKRLDSRVTFTRASNATYTDEYGVIRTVANNVPRFDHDPVTGESLGLLIEESRTNLVTYSANLTQWPTANNVTYSLSNVLSPDGESYAYEMKENTANFYHAGYPSSISLDGSSKYTISAWLKRGSNYRTDIANGTFQLYCSRGTGSVAYIILNSDFNAIVSHSNTDNRSLTLYPNGWVKVTYTFTSNAAGGVVAHFLFGGGGSYLGDGVSNVYIWGVQVEVGSFPTSYIPTSGATATRSADLASITGTNFTSWYNQKESTILVESLNVYNQFPTGHTGSGFGFYTNGNFFGGGWSFTHGRDRHVNPENGYGADWRTIHPVLVSDGGSFSSAPIIASSTFPVSTNSGSTFYKAAMAINSTSIIASSKGYISVTSHSVPLPNPIALTIGRDLNYSAYSAFNGLIKQIMYWDKDVTNTQLQALTS